MNNNNKYSKKETLNKSPFFLSYFITDPIEYGDTPEILSLNLTNSLNKHKIDMICFRDKTSQNKEILAATILNIAQKYNIKYTLINSDITLAIKLGFDGIHLTSTQFNDIKCAKKHNLFTIISCHTQNEVQKAKQLGCDAVTYSPIFYKENKAKPKGIKNLQDIITKYQDKDFKIIALGGIIDNSQVNQIKTTDASGFASIRYFI